MGHNDSALQNSQLGPKAVKTLAATASPSDCEQPGCSTQTWADAAPEPLVSCLKLRSHKLPTAG